jgi:CheY-like chemotaxis protein
MSKEVRVLLVEDDEDDVFILRRAIAALELPVALQIAKNGDEAVDYLGGQNGFEDRNQFPMPDLVFLDLKMPGRDGFDVLAWRRDQPGLSMPFAILSSSPEERDMKRARELGADCYLIKPPTKEMLLACLRQFGIQAGQR